MIAAVTPVLAVIALLIGVVDRRDLGRAALGGAGRCVIALVLLICVASALLAADRSPAAGGTSAPTRCAGCS